MKTLRFVLIAGAAAVVLIAALAAVALNSGFQTWAARRLLAARPSLRASVGSVSMGPGWVEVSDLRFEKDGLEFAFPAVEGRFPLWPAVWRKELAIQNLSARGWTLDMSGLPLSPMENALENEISKDPRVLLLALASELPRHIPERIAGYKVSAAPAGRIVDLQGVVILPPVPGGGRSGPGMMNFNLTGVPTTNGEAFSAEFAVAGRQFGLVRGHYVDSSRRFIGRWKVDLADGAGSLNATRGEGSIDVAAAEVHFAGRLSTGARRLAGVLPEPAALEGLAISAEFDVVRRGAAWRVDGLTADVEGSRQILELNTLQRFEFNPETREVRMAEPTRDLARITLQDVPLEWVRPWLAPVALSGADIRGVLIASPGGGGLRVRSESPLTIDDLSGSRHGRQLFRNVSVSLTTTAEIRPNGWQVGLSPLIVRSGSGEILSAEAKLGRLAGPRQALKFAGRMSADLHAILAQPAAGGRIDLKRGRLSCEFAGSFDAQRSIDAKIDLADLESDADPDGLPAVSAEVRADLGADGRLTFSAPLRLLREGRESTLAVSGTLVRNPTGIGVDVQATGDQLNSDDMQVLAAPFAEASRRLARPFWSGIGGRLVFGLGRATLAGHVSVSDLKGTVGFGPDVLRLEGLRASLERGEIAGAGELDFEPTVARPYAYKADFKLDNFDAAPFFSALSRDRPPTFEGKFDLTGHFAGRSRDLRDIPAQATGECSLTSKGGVFRVLSKGIELKTESADKIAAIGAFIGSVADTVTFRKDPHIQEKRARAVSEFSEIMTAIPYDRIDVILSRNASMTTEVREFSLISPEVRIEGGGSVASRPEAAFLEQPLSLGLKLRARGRTAELLRTAGLLATAEDDLGYTACTLPLDVGGTILAPELESFRSALLGIALGQTAR
jgi:hypothetical protein